MISRNIPVPFLASPLRSPITSIADDYDYHLRPHQLRFHGKLSLYLP